MVVLGARRNKADEANVVKTFPQPITPQRSLGGAKDEDEDDEDEGGREGGQMGIDDRSAGCRIYCLERETGRGIVK